MVKEKEVKKYRVWNSTIVRRTPLKPSNKSLKRTPIKRSYKPIKTKQKTAKKLKGEYFSVFTNDFSRCIVSVRICKTHPHHIFGAGNKARSEKYGFIIPLAPDWHEGTRYSIHEDRKLELYWKKKCQDYYVSVLGKTKEEWIQEFGKWWI
ncbi:MAG: hypothetical protein IK121_07020, partial [Lachnospiraceae bacterium]|nr:hypothetical protein [Lachnospiraceae bacterium]